MSAFRVSGGELRGRHLASESGRGAPRPTTERVREAVFSILGPIDGARVLDLCCGTGALGIEALSRGAATAELVDLDSRIAGANVEALGLGPRAGVIRSDAVRYLERAAPDGFDLIFFDPPYTLADRLGAQLDDHFQTALAPKGRLVIESAAGSPAPVSLPLVTERRYGDTLIRIHSGGEGS